MLPSRDRTRLASPPEQIEIAQRLRERVGIEGMERDGSAGR